MIAELPNFRKLILKIGDGSALSKGKTEKRIFKKFAIASSLGEAIEDKNGFRKIGDSSPLWSNYRQFASC